MRLAALLVVVALWGACSASAADERFPPNDVQDAIATPTTISFRDVLENPNRVSYHRVPDFPAFQRQLEVSPQFLQMFEERPRHHRRHRDRDDDEEEEDEDDEKRKHRKDKKKTRKELQEERREARREAKKEREAAKKAKKEKERLIKEREKMFPRPPFAYNSIYNPWAPHAMPPNGGEALANMYPTGTGLGDTVDATSLPQQFEQGIPGLPTNVPESGDETDEDDEDEDLDDDEKKEKRKQRQKEKEEREKREQEQRQQQQQQLMQAQAPPPLPSLSPYLPSPASYPQPPQDMELRRRWQIRPPPIGTQVPWVPYNIPGHFVHPALTLGGDM